MVHFINDGVVPISSTIVINGRLVFNFKLFANLVRFSVNLLETSCPRKKSILIRMYFCSIFTETSKTSVRKV